MITTGISDAPESVDSVCPHIDEKLRSPSAVGVAAKTRRYVPRVRFRAIPPTIIVADEHNRLALPCLAIIGELARIDGDIVAVYLAQIVPVLVRYETETFLPSLVLRMLLVSGISVIKYSSSITLTCHRHHPPLLPM